MSAPRNIHQQLDELEREQRMRASLYPGFVSRGKLRQGEADEQTARLDAAVVTLRWCRDNREIIAEAQARIDVPQISNDLATAARSMLAAGRALSVARTLTAIPGHDLALAVESFNATFAAFQTAFEEEFPN